MEEALAKAVVEVEEVAEARVREAQEREKRLEEKVRVPYSSCYYWEH